MSAIPYLLLNALIAVESNGRDDAIGKWGELGCLQISAIAHRDIERITKRPIPRDDAFDRKKACLMALVYLSHYANPRILKREPTLRDYALIWHYGPTGWKRPDPDPYWEKVKSQILATHDRSTLTQMP